MLALGLRLVCSSREQDRYSIMQSQCCFAKAFVQGKHRSGVLKMSLFYCAACRRVGGAFGGKVARSMPVAAAAAVAAAKTGRRVRYSLSRNDDMRINGGEHATCLLCWHPS